MNPASFSIKSSHVENSGQEAVSTRTAGGERDGLLRETTMTDRRVPVEPTKEETVRALAAMFWNGDKDEKRAAKYLHEYASLLAAAPQAEHGKVSSFGIGEPARHSLCPDENDRCQHGDDLNCPAVSAIGACSVCLSASNQAHAGGCPHGEQPTENAGVFRTFSPSDQKVVFYENAAGQSQSIQAPENQAIPADSAPSAPFLTSDEIAAYRRRIGANSLGNCVCDQALLSLDLARDAEYVANLVYVIAMLCMSERNYDRPQIGDWAVECSHLIGMPKNKRVGLPLAIGKVISVENHDCYTLTLLNGKEQRWENAMMRKLPSLDISPEKEKP